MVTSSAPRPDPATTSMTDQIITPHSALGSPNSKGQFSAIDAHSSFLSAERTRELANLYASVFNGVSSVEAKWTGETALSLLTDRLKRPGSMIALVDTESDKIVGGFFARIVPGRDGISLSEPDVFLHPDYRGKGLGNEIGFVGRQYATELSKEYFHEDIKDNISQTYRIPDFPKNMWENHGYKLTDLYVQNADALLTRRARGKVPKVVVRVPKRDELDSLASLMSSDKTITSDGAKWTKKRARAFLDYMAKLNIALLRVADNGNGVVGLMAGDTIQRRSGSSLISIHGFIAPRKDTESIAATLTYQVVSAANTVSLSKTEQPVTEIELSPAAREFFGTFLPSLVRDETFLNMSGDHATITQSLKPSVPQIAQVWRSKQRLHA